MSERLHRQPQRYARPEGDGPQRLTEGRTQQHAGRRIERNLKARRYTGPRQGDQSGRADEACDIQHHDVRGGHSMVAAAVQES